MAAALLAAAGGGAAGKSGGGARSLWARAGQSSIIIGVARQMGADFAEMADDPDMLEELTQLEGVVTGLWGDLLAQHRREQPEAEGGGLPFALYLPMHLRIAKSLDADFTTDQGQAVCWEDWKVDCGRKMLGDNALDLLVRQARAAKMDEDEVHGQLLNKHQFLAAIFELCALWAERSQLASFARALVGNIGARPSPDAPWALRDLDAVGLLALPSPSDDDEEEEPSPTIGSGPAGRAALSAVAGDWGMPKPATRMLSATVPRVAADAGVPPFSALPPPPTPLQSCSDAGAHSPTQ